jgi:hypothetical protein
MPSINQIAADTPTGGSKGKQSSYKAIQRPAEETNYINLKLANRIKVGYEDKNSERAFAQRN